MSEHQSHPSVRAYVLVWAALMVLMVLTIGAAMMDLGAWNLLVALTIATTKALLVVLIFMHVRYSNPIVWIFSGAAFLWLGILFVLTFQDYVTRQYMWEPEPGRSHVAPTQALPTPQDLPRVER